MVFLVGVFLFKEVICWGVEIFYVLKVILKKKGFLIVVGDEGGFVLNLVFNEDIIDNILEVIKNVGYKVGEEVFIGFDVVVLEFFDKVKGKYVFKKFIKEEFIFVELVEYYVGLV